jgi:transcription-repair coupling factor (superfamily II helicase)
MWCILKHGFGVFSGIQYMSTDSAQREYLILSYAAGDKLYVPIDQIDRINRYIGAGESAPSLSRLGTQEWNRTKQKVKESVEEIAQDLLQLYAAREVVSGHAYSADTTWQQEFEASFPYMKRPIKLRFRRSKKVMAPLNLDSLVIGDVVTEKQKLPSGLHLKSGQDNNRWRCWCRRRSAETTLYYIQQE